MDLKVFLSYDHDDFDAANVLKWEVQALRPTWQVLDCPTDISFDCAKAEQVGLKATSLMQLAHAVVCVVGKRTYKSRWVDWELKMALHMNRPVIAADLYGDGRIRHRPTLLEGMPQVPAESVQVAALLEQIARRARRAS